MFYISFIQGESIHTLCNAKVDVDVYSEKGRYYGYHSRAPEKEFRNIGIQRGESFIPSRQSTRIARNNTPTKKNTAAVPTSVTGGTPSPTSLPSVIGLPGRRKKATIPKPKQSSRCKICRVIWLSKADIELRREKKREAEWMGCQIDDCDYWAHAFCVGIKVGRKSVANIPFVCPLHSREV